MLSINAYAYQIIEACAAATAVAISIPCARGMDRVAGWKEFVEPVRQHSLFWHRMWSDCGRPHTGTVADIMRRTCAAYHCAVRRVNERTTIRQRFAEVTLTTAKSRFLGRGEETYWKPRVAGQGG
jgi:hypothetical protein